MKYLTREDVISQTSKEFVKNLGYMPCFPTSRVSDVDDRIEWVASDMFKDLRVCVWYFTPDINSDDIDWDDCMMGYTIERR
jgi:hypothetical protein